MNAIHNTVLAVAIALLLVGQGQAQHAPGTSIPLGPPQFAIDTVTVESGSEFELTIRKLDAPSPFFLPFDLGFLEADATELVFLGIDEGSSLEAYLQTLPYLPHIALDVDPVTNAANFLVTADTFDVGTFGDDFLRVTAQVLAPAGTTVELILVTPSGNQAVPIEVVASTSSPTPPTVDEEPAPTPDPEFRRGDLDEDGQMGMGDVIDMADVLFRGGENDCPDAVDFNDNGSLEIADLIGVLDMLFGNSLSQLPTCEIDTTPDILAPCVTTGVCTP